MADFSQVRERAIPQLIAAGQNNTFGRDRQAVFQKQPQKTSRSARFEARFKGWWGAAGVEG